MPTVTTSTADGALPQGGLVSFPPMTLMERAPDTGHLWLIFRTTTTTVTIYRSIDNAASWQAQGSFTRAGLYDLSDFSIDQAGDHIHIVYLVNESSQDRMFYKRIDIRSGTPSFSTGEMQITAGNNGGTARSYWYSACIYAYKNPDGTFAILIPGAFHQSSYSGIYIYGVSIKNDAVFSTYKNDGIVRSTHQYRLSGDDSGGLTVCRDVEHNGDGYTTKTPNVWLAFQIHSTSYCLKLTWQGYKTGWSSPTSAPSIATSRLSSRDLPARWDGKRFVIMSTNPTDPTKMDVFERDAGNTKNVVKRTSPTHPNNTGTINANMLSYNHVTQDFRLFAVGVSPGPLYYVDFIRASGTWGTWTQAEGATSITTSEWSVRRSTYGTNQYDVYRTTGTASPWTMGTYALAVNFAPTAPTWVTGTAGTPPTNGAAFDVSASLTLDWVHNDPNLTDAQTQYALQRQIGAGTVQWWRTSDSTWQTVETFNTSATSAVTLSAAQWVGAGGAGDPAHVYKVATKDTGGLTSPYSSGLGVVPSTRTDPTLTAPTGGAILNTGLVVANWTCADQSAYRVTVTNTATGVVVHDSGWQADPAGQTSGYVVPVLLADGFTGSLTLQTKNGEGLSSVVRTAAFTIDFVEPVAPLVTGLVPAPNSGGINVTVTQPAPTGTQPATVRMDLYRRKATGVLPTNSNPYFETNLNDWGQTGYSVTARSSTFAHTGTWSLLLTPNGVTASPYTQTSTIYPTSTGAAWTANGWFRSTTANKTVRLKLQWYNASSALISESVRDFTPVAGVWIWMSMTAGAPDLATGVRWACGQTGTPAAGDTVYLDEAVLMPANQDDGIRTNFDIASGVTYLDWRAVTGVEYEYRVYAEAANGTRVYGPWQA